MTEVVKCSPWGLPTSKKAIIFTDIVKEQEVVPDTQIHSTRDEEDLDYQFALKLQNEQLEEDRQLYAEFDDLSLAQVMQFIEDDEVYSSPKDQPKKSKSTQVSKISVGTNAMEVGPIGLKGVSVVSSDYLEAVELKNSLEGSQRSVHSIFKHDPLLQGLSNAASLSELDGVGDLVGSKLLINNRVSNSLKTFVHKNDGRAIRRKIGKAKKASTVVISGSSPEEPAPQVIPSEMKDVEDDVDDDVEASDC